MRASSIAMSGLMLAIFAAMTGIAFVLYPEGARFQPLVIGVPAIALSVLQLVLDLRAPAAKTLHVPAPMAAPSPLAVTQDGAGALSPRREAVAWAFFLGLIAGVLLLGFWITIPVFIAAFLRFEARAGWPATIVLAVGASAVLYGLFEVVLRVPLHRGFVWQMLMPA